MRTEARAVLLACALVAGLPAPAHAETRVVKDKRKDAPVIVDVIRAKLTNGEDTFRSVVTFRKLAPEGLALNLSLDTFDVADWRNYNIGVSRRDGEVDVSVIVLYDGGGETVPCPQITATWTAGRRGTIVVEAPRECFDLTSTVGFDALAVVEGDIGDRTTTVAVTQD